jgi:peptide/nickel transport system permease protein
MMASATVRSDVLEQPISMTQSRHRRSLFRDWRFQIGGAVVLLTILAAFLAPLLPLPNPDYLGTTILLPPLTSWSHVLGTDSYGRDLLSRIIYGGQVSIETGVGSTAIALVFGSGAGALAAYFGGRTDSVVMRVMDALLAFPPLLLAIVLVGALGATVLNVIAAIGIVYIPVFARVTRAKVLTVRRSLYVESARSLGASHGRILIGHILPNSVGPVIVQATVAFAYSVVAQAGLSYLGLGVPPPAPSWGSMLSDAQNYFTTQPWYALEPGLALALFVACVSLIGDAIRDAAAADESPI